MTTHWPVNTTGMSKTNFPGGMRKPTSLCSERMECFTTSWKQGQPQFVWDKVCCGFKVNLLHFAHFCGAVYQSCISFRYFAIVIISMSYSCIYRVRLSKRRKLGGAQMAKSRLIVKHREVNEREVAAQVN